MGGNSVATPFIVSATFVEPSQGAATECRPYKLNRKRRLCPMDHKRRLRFIYCSKFSRDLLN